MQIKNILDTETTGLSVGGGDRVIEIACVEVCDLIPTGRVFHRYLNVDKQISDVAYSIHGISNEFLRNYSGFSDVVGEFLGFIGGNPIVAHNASFDVKFINNELSILNLPLLDNEIIDTLELAKKIVNRKSLSLDSLCRYYNIDNSSRVKHGALLDAELLSEVYLHLCGGSQRELFGKIMDRVINVDDVGQINIMKRAFSLSDDDYKKHVAMLRKFSNSLWNC